MMTIQEQYDDAMFDFSMGEFDASIAKLKVLLAQDPEYFDAQLSLGMAYCRKGDYATAIAEGHKAEKMRPHEQLVHTNLSLFYMRAGDKKTAEHHGLQARISSWRGNMAPTGTQPGQGNDPELQIAPPPPPPATVVQGEVKYPEMPWKKNAKVGGDHQGETPEANGPGK
ncbi:MAG: hypothetical protein WCO56_25915 [Verrucomicrobiota bacterium]